MTSHTDKVYEEELNDLKSDILKMGSLVEEMFGMAMKSLFDRDSAVALEVISRERGVNRLEIAIDDQCIKILARRQPAASDLRFITIGLKISKDLERMGDLSVNIAQRASEINREPPLKPYVDLPKLAEKVKIMVKDSLDAFVNLDTVKAQAVCESDDAVDDLNSAIYEELVELMQKDSSTITRAMNLILLSRHLERIADHATNIAEEVIFMVKGKDIRHGGGNDDH